MKQLKNNKLEKKTMRKERMGNEVTEPNETKGKNKVK